MLVLILGTGLYLQVRLGGMPIRAHRQRAAARLARSRRRRRRPRRGEPVRRADDLPRGHDRRRQHRGRRDGDRARRAGRGVLDVDDRAGRHGHQVRRSRARSALPRARRATGAGSAARCTRSARGSGRRWAWLGTAFALFGGLAGFGIGNMVQANSIAAAMQTSFGVSTTATGIVLFVLTAAVILGGIQRISAVANWLVPFMAIGYIVAALVVLVTHAADVPAAFATIVDERVHADRGHRRLRGRRRDGRPSATASRAASSRTRRGSAPPASRRRPASPRARCAAA